VAQANANSTGTREFVVRLEGGANGTNAPSFADLVRTPPSLTLEQQNLQLRQLVQQQQQQLQQQLPLQSPSPAAAPAVALAAGRSQDQEAARIVALVVQNLTPALTQAVLAAMPSRN
jgi:hypothetical protein